MQMPSHLSSLVTISRIPLLTWTHPGTVVPLRRFSVPSHIKTSMASSMEPPASPVWVGSYHGLVFQSIVTLYPIPDYASLRAVLWIHSCPSNSPHCNFSLHTPQIIWLVPASILEGNFLIEGGGEEGVVNRIISRRGENGHLVPPTFGKQEASRRG